MFQRALGRAIDHIKKNFSTPYEAGRTIGKNIPTIVTLGKWVKDHYGNTRKVNVEASPIHEIFVDKNGNISEDGKRVAVIYEDGDGHLHKNLGDKWYIWNGSNWVENSV